MSYDDQRGSSAQRGYGSRWQKAREGYLKKHSLCVMHLERGQYVAATVVDHITPHKGDNTLFWARDNWQSLCADCHNIHKQRFEKSGRVSGCDTKGIPNDPNHHWLKG